MSATVPRWHACAVRCAIALWLLVSPVPGIACEVLDTPKTCLRQSCGSRRQIGDGLGTTVRAPNRGISHFGYQMVVAPGDYDISVVRYGKPVSAIVRVGASDRDVLWLQFHSDGGHCLRRAGATRAPMSPIR